MTNAEILVMLIHVVATPIVESLSLDLSSQPSVNARKVTLAMQMFSVYLVSVCFGSVVFHDIHRTL